MEKVLFHTHKFIYQIQCIASILDNNWLIHNQKIGNGKSERISKYSSGSKMSEHAKSHVTCGGLNYSLIIE